MNHDTPPTSEHSFTDPAGRRWSLRVDYAAVRRIHADTGVDLLDGAPIDRVADLLGSVERMVDAVYAVARPQADAGGLTAFAFAESLTGDDLVAARRALLAGLVGFFPKADRAALRAAMELAETMAATAPTTCERACAELRERLASIPDP